MDGEALPQGAANRDSESREAADDTTVGDVPGTPTWPIAPGNTRAVTPPPVGLNWGVVAQALGIDLEILLHDGSIVAGGDYFPEAGCFIDPSTFAATSVDVGDMALRPGYFLSRLSMNEFGIALPQGQPVHGSGLPVMRDTEGGVIGLFADDVTASRAQRKIVQGSLGSGISLTHGPLGVELHVRTPELLGRVATVLAGQGGAIISIGGVPVGAQMSGEPATTAINPSGPFDTPREGTGSASNV